jgi:hypothetical protein
VLRFLLKAACSRKVAMEALRERVVLRLILWRLDPLRPKNETAVVENCFAISLVISHHAHQRGVDRFSSLFIVWLIDAIAKGSEQNVGD